MREKTIPATESKIDGLLREIAVSFDIPVGIFDLSGRALGNVEFEERSNFCRFLHFYDTAQMCRQSYLQVFCQCSRENKPQISFCPFGLINITFPVPGKDDDPCFITVGPLLYEEPNDRMIDNILHLNCQLRPRAREIRQDLSEIKVCPEERVRSMMMLIESALRGISYEVPHKVSHDNEDETTVLLHSLELWLVSHSCDDDESRFRSLCHEVEQALLAEPGDLRSDAVAEKMDAFLDDIFSSQELYLEIYRGVKWLTSMIFLFRKQGIDLKMLLFPGGIDLNDLIQAAETETLKTLLYRAKLLLLRCCDSHNEVYRKDVIFRAMHYIRNHYQDISLREVAEYVGLNPSYFSNLFKRSTGQSYSYYLNKIRIEESKHLLLKNYSLSEIAQIVGFSDQSYFTNVFKRQEGISPLRWKMAQEEKEVLF